MSGGSPLFNYLMFGIPRVGAAIRLIPQFDGDTTHGVLDTPITFTGDFEIEVGAANLNSALGFIENIIGGTSNADDKFDYRENAELAFKTDGTALVSGTELSAYDGAIHVLKGARIGAVGSFKLDENVIASGAVPTGDSVWGFIAVKFDISSHLKGHIPYIKFTDKSGAEDVVTLFTLDSETTPGITWTGMTDANWNRYNSNNEYVGSGIAGSQLIQLEGTATTPLSSSTTVTGSAWRMNWEGLWVSRYASGVGAYTYLAAPDGKAMRLDIDDIDSVTAYSMLNEKTTVQSVDNMLEFFALSIGRASRVLDMDLTGNSIPTAAGLANKVIIETGGGGTVLVDS